MLCPLFSQYTCPYDLYLMFLHCILFTLVLTHLATLALIIKVEKRPTYRRIVEGGSIAIVKKKQENVIYLGKNRNFASLYDILISRP